MIRAICPLVVFLAALSPFSIADETPIALLTPVEATLTASDSDSYIFEAEANQFVAGAADQRTVDVVVTIFGPDDVKLADFDGPGVGPEHFSFETSTAGQYRIEVTPFEKAEGEYAITLRMLEPVAKDGAKRADQLMAAYSGEATPGGVVIVVQEGEVLFEKAYGMANLVHAVPFSVGTPSNLGSTSKQFTGFAIALLESQGKLSVDDDIRKHIPELKEFEEVITLRHLLSHTSGYREFLNTLSMAGRRLDEGDFIGREELIEIVQRQPRLQNTPGSEFNYNNTGFGLLTVVVERVTGEKFPVWMKANVFEPLGMTNTIVRSKPTQLIPGCSQGYGLGEFGFQNSRDLGGAMGAGAIYSTVGDLAKWMRNLQTGELGGAKVLEAMTTPFELTTGESTDYGFGLFLDEHNSLRRIQHGGADSAHRAMLAIYPEIEGGVVTLSNNAGFDAGGIAAKIAEAFFGDHMKTEEAPSAAVAEASAPKPEKFDAANYDPTDFDDFVGRFELEAMKGFVLSFTREEDHFYTQGSGQPKLEIVPTSALTFALQGVDAVVEFERDESGKCTSLVLHQNGHHKATRLEDEPDDSKKKSLTEYTGRYFSAELETIYEITIEEDQLVVHHRRLEDMKLTHVKGHDFAGRGGVSCAFVASTSGEIWGFEVSNGRTRGVSFTRMR